MLESRGAGVPENRITMRLHHYLFPIAVTPTEPCGPSVKADGVFQARFALKAAAQPFYLIPA